MEIDDRLLLLELSARLIQWANAVEINPYDKREFIKIIYDFSKKISWKPERAQEAYLKPLCSVKKSV